MKDLETLLPLICGATALLVTSFTEWLQCRRTSRVMGLAFGPSSRPRRWTQAVPLFRVAALTALSWSLATLFVAHLNKGGSASAEVANRSENIFLLLDYSPSMLLADAGPDGEFTRKQRMREVADSIVERLGEHVQYSFACFQSEIYPIAERVYDKAVIRNMFNDLPVEKAMNSTGPTDLGHVINQTLNMLDSDLASDTGSKNRFEYADDSTTLILISDGDSLEIEAIRELPGSVKRALVLGVGNPDKGLIVGSEEHYSKQDPVALTAIARSLDGEYIDVNKRHLASSSMNSLRGISKSDGGKGISHTELARVVFIVTAMLYGSLAILQEFFGSDWRVCTRGPSTKELA